jgi:Icc protein
MRILQLSDPHLLADPGGRCRGALPLRQLRDGLEKALALLHSRATPPDLLLISGDLCQDESLGGYARLRDLLQDWPTPLPPLALLPGNHDHPALLRAALGRQAVIAPAELGLGSWRLLLLDSHCCGSAAGRLGARQRAWLAERLAAAPGPVLVALHHPPLPIGDPGLDPIRLEDGEELLALLRSSAGLAAVLFGHVHQHWRGELPGRAAVPLLACPSTLCAFAPVQPCPLASPRDPGARLLELGTGGEIRQELLRWMPVAVPMVG